jgi:ribosome-binding factor A
MSRRRHVPRQYPRTARVNEVVRESLAGELERLSDPRLGFVTVTGVEVSRDLRFADVYYSVLGSADERVESANALQSATPHLRGVVGRQVRLKYNPELRFREDPAIAQGQRIDEVIRSIHDTAQPGSGRDDEDTT